MQFMESNHQCLTNKKRGQSRTEQVKDDRTPALREPAPDGVRSEFQCLVAGKDSEADKELKL